MCNSWPQRLLALALAMTPPAALALPTPAADEPKSWFHFRVLPDNDEKHRDKEVLYLRPNTEHEVEIYLKNPEEEAVQNATVKLVKRVNNQIRVLAQTTGVQCSARGETKIKFAKGPEKPPDKSPEKGKEPKTEPLIGPVQNLQLVLEANNKVLATENLFVKIKHPQSYILAQGHFDRAKKRLSVHVAMKETAMVGPRECVVQLELDPLFTTGLKPPEKHDLVRKLTKPGKYEELFAADLDFDSVSEVAKDARIFLTIDGFKRAFEFQTAFNDTGYLLNAAYTQEVAVRFKTSRFAAPTPKFSLELNMDGPIDQAIAVNVGVDRAGNGQFVKIAELLGLRDVALVIEPSEKSSLACKSEVRDWQVLLDTSNLAAAIDFQVHLMDKGLAISADAMRPLNWLQFDRAQLWSPLTYDKSHVWAKVELSDKLPAGVRFEPKLPEKWPADKPLAVKATYDKAAVAPIKEVVFFYGDVTKDGKIPADAVKKVGKSDPKKDDVWLADLPPPGKVGNQRVSVVFTTLTERQQVAGVEIMFFDPAAVAPQPVSIKGTVFHVTVTKAGLPVKLFDAKGKQVDMVMSGDKGEFVFANVAPGDYTVRSESSTPYLIGSTIVTVKGKDVENVRVVVQSK